MGDNNTNNGVAGIVGRVEGDGNVKGSTLTQGAAGLQATERFSREHVAVIVALAEALAARQIEGVSLKERLGGAQQLMDPTMCSRFLARSRLW